MLSPTVVVNLSDEDVNAIAAEPSEIEERRAFLESQKSALEEGMKIFRLILSQSR